MDRNDEEILKKLLPIFKIEAQDHLKVMFTGLMGIEKSDPEKRAEIIETVYRESHSLKGAARSVNRSDIAVLCQSMESVFSALKHKEIILSSRMLDLLHQTVASTSKLVAGEALSPCEESEIAALIRALEKTIQKQKHAAPAREAAGDMESDTVAGEQVPGEEKSPAVEPALIAKNCASPEIPAAVVPVPTLTGTIRMSTAKLDAILLRAEEMLSVKLATGRHTGELRELRKTFVRWKKERAKNRPCKTAGREAVKEIDDDKSFLASFESGLTTLVKAAEYDHRSLGTMVDALLDDMKKTMMLPFSSLVEIFPKLVRDLSRDAGKEVDLTTDGNEIEIDRRVLEELKGPLIHLVRNCIDHGIETTEERKRKGKPLRGNIRIGVSSRDSSIEITVSDDGAGIDALKVKAAAEKCGAISREEAQSLDEHETQLLIFRSGVTTSPIITDISGRGLGSAIVKEKVEKLNGTIAMDTQPDIGTTFRLIVPLTLATFRGVLVRMGEQLFVLPSANIERVARVKKEGIQTVEHRETIALDGQTISLARLGDVLELKTGADRSGSDDSLVQVVVLGSAGKRMAFVVDEILHEQEVLVKTLGSQLSRVRNIAGATLLGSGKVVPILNVPDLMISAVKVAPISAGAVVEGPSKRISILVVEDSITARALLKGILESTGYDVTTAVDGLDALTALKTREFDLVVSDVEMPRMNGFDLTAKIRTDKKLSELPVVLVTALESREDRERGIDVGANAYIVKSSFEQSNLLEVVGRLT
ncbi:MAG: response regulator [Deltaproteobacteria bacterium]|nr:response regulator [Deltaproteobacteria bacterium]